MRSIGFSRKKVYSDVVKLDDPVRMMTFCDTIRSVEDTDIICIDEAGFYIGDHQRYGYAPKGTRIHVPCSATLRRSRLTLIMAISSTGVVHYDILDHNCRKTDFVQFIQQLPLVSCAGKKLLMDNVPFHHSKETLNAIKDKGCTPLFIPPYSPRFNAIEYVFSAVKRSYRRECTVLSQLNILSELTSHEYAGILSGVLQTSAGFQNYFAHVRRSVQDATSVGGVNVCGYD
jgi:transposase